MKLKLKVLLTWLPVLVAIILPALAGAADFDAPIASQLTLKQTGAVVTAAWAGKPGVALKNATLTILLKKDGGVQKQLLKQTLSLPIGKVGSAACNLPLAGAGSYQVVALLKMGMAGGQYAKTNSVRFTLGSAGKVTVVAEPVIKAGQFINKFRPSLPRRAASAGPRVASAAAPVKFSGFTVSGQVRFTNVRFASTHTTQTVETKITTESLPIQGVKLQICDLISSSSFYYYQVLGTVYPSANGNFSYYVNSNDDGDGTGRDIFLHLVADSGDCKVQDFSGGIYALDRMPYATLSGGVKVLPVDWTGGNMNLGVTQLSLDMSGPWNIVDAVQQGGRFVRSCGVAAPKAIVRWETGSLNGTYFDSATRMISLLGNAADSDEFDDAVILHEYGHLAANSLSGDKSPGGSHYFDQPANRALAWSEGWATFFSCAARNSSFMIDSVNNVQMPGLSVDLETFSDIYSFDYRRGDDVEACVAAALWDIFDAASDYRDVLSDRMPHIWPIFDGYFDATRSCTFSDFYAGWQSRGYPALAQMRTILDVFGVNYWGGLMVNSLLINNDGQEAPSRTVTLNNLVSGAPVQYMASESPLFIGAGWQPYAAAPKFTLSAGDGYKRVFFKVRNAAGAQSVAKFDIIYLHEMRTLTVGAGALARTLPDVFSFDWYKLKISTTARYKILTTTSTAGASPIVAVYKASDLGAPLFVGAYPALEIHQIFPAGDYVVAVFSGASAPVAGGGIYSIQVNATPTLKVSGAALTGKVPGFYDYDCYKLKIGTKGRYKLVTTPPSGRKLTVGVFKAGDVNLTSPLFVSASPALDINEIFPAGDFMIVVVSDDANPVPALNNNYSIRISPYSWTIGG